MAQHDLEFSASDWIAPSRLSELLPQVKELKYLRVLFTSEGKGAGTAVIWALDHTVVVQREPTQKAKLLIYCGHELWVSSVGSLRDPPYALGGAWKCCWREGRQDYFA